MLARALADLLVVFHLGFVVFVVVGGLLVLRWPRVAWLHLPAAAWGVAIELGGWVCPLTPLENSLRRAGDGTGYEGGFVEQYVLPVLYPPGLEIETQWLLAGVVLVTNFTIYWIVWRRRTRPHLKS